MNHSFDIDVAKEYGIESAILLDTIWQWVEKNRANDVHFHDGEYWTYCSAKGFAEYFPYMTQRTINYTLQKMIAADLIKKGNYNEDQMNRTLWFTLGKIGKCILQNCKMHVTNLQNVPYYNNKYIYTYNRDDFLTMVKEKCEVLYDRYSCLFGPNTSSKQQDVLQIRLDKAIAQVSRNYTLADLEEVFDHVSRTYIVRPKFASLDIFWVLDNLEKVKRIEEREESAESASYPKKDKPASDKQEEIKIDISKFTI